MTATLGGLNERIGEQVAAVELLRDSATQTDALLERLMRAVQALAEQAAEREMAAQARQSVFAAGREEQQRGGA